MRPRASMRSVHEPDERIATEALAADHGLEQIGIRAVGELEVNGERGVQVGARFGDDWDAGFAQRSRERMSRIVAA